MSATNEWLGLLVDWSIRWSVLILALMVFSAMGISRTIAARLCLARLVLIAGLLLPFGPRWWAAPWSSPKPTEPAFVPRADAFERTLPSKMAEPPNVSSGASARPISDSRPVLATGVPAENPDPIDWRLVAAGIWFTGSGLLLVRLVAGYWWLARLRRSATPLCGSELSEFQTVRLELGVRRRVEFLSSGNVAGPILIAGWPSAVVVPADWSSWSESDRRSALLHELAHVRGWDEWCGIAEHFVRAAFFFHPLVRWLLIWLSRLREQRCDAVVVSHGISQTDVARLLLDGVRRIGPGRSLLPATPMFNRNSVRERIDRLLEEDMKSWSRPLTHPLAVWTAAVVVGLWFVVGGYGAKPDQAPKQGGPPQFQGTVSGPDGRRVAGATVIAVGDVGNGDRLTTTTDTEGRFSFVALPAGKTVFPSVYIYIVKKGFGPLIHLVTEPSKSNSVDLKLPAAGSFHGTITNSAGVPVAGADVQVGYVHRSKSPSSRGQSWGFEPPQSIRGTPAEPFFFAVSGESGQFQFPELPADSELIFRVSAKGFAELDTGAGGPKEGQHIVKADAASAELVLAPEAIIRGRVTSNTLGVSPDAAMVKLTGGRELHGFQRVVKPEADGRFEARGLPAGSISVSLELPPDVPATAAGSVVTAKTGQTTDVELALIRGVEVTGLVMVRDSKEPVPGVWMATNGLVSPTGFHFAGKPTGADGKFTLQLPPGKIDVFIWRTTGDYCQIDGRRQKIEVPANTARYEITEPFVVGKIGTNPAPGGATTAQEAGPVPVAAEAQAAAAIRQHGGWYKLDSDGHVVEVNMVYNEEAGGKRTDNHLVDSDGALRAASQFLKLKKLYLTQRQASDEGLSALTGLTNLEEFMVWDASAVSNAGIAHLAGLPKLKVVHVSNGAIGDEALAVFARLPSIESLGLQGNNFSDAGLKHLAGMKRLKSLWIGMSKQTITDAGVQHLAGLENLERLDLQYARLTSAGISALKDLKRLNTLYLDGPNAVGEINDSAIPTLLGMNQLQHIDLGTTTLTAAGVNQLITHPTLKSLSLSTPLIKPAAIDDLKQLRPNLKLSITNPGENK